MSVSVEILPYLTTGMKGMLLRNSRGKEKFVAWKMNSNGYPHHDKIGDDLFPEWDIIVKVFQGRFVQIQVDDVDSIHQANKAIEKVLPEFDWDNLDPGDELFVAITFRDPDTGKGVSENFEGRIRDLPKIGLRSRFNHGRLR